MSKESFLIEHTMKLQPIYGKLKVIWASYMLWFLLEITFDD